MAESVGADDGGLEVIDQADEFPEYELRERKRSARCYCSEDGDRVEQDIEGSGIGKNPLQRLIYLHVKESVSNAHLVGSKGATFRSILRFKRF